MKKNIIWVFLTLILASCGGVSEQTKETMVHSLSLKLPDLYQAEGITIYKVKPEIISVIDGSNPYHTKYWVTFSCGFEDLGSGDVVYIYGDAGFDEYGFIDFYSTPYYEGAAYHISTVHVNNRVADTSKYNLTRNMAKAISAGSPAQSAAKPSGKTNDETVSEAKSFGLSNPHITNDGFLAYSESPSKITTDPDWVAQQMYEMFSDNDTLVGVRILSAVDGKTLGQYKAK